MAPRIAILGWGSLLWDENEAFDSQHLEWLPDGPNLNLEFSRISKKRGGGLTLVIDPENGASCTVSHTFSKRPDLDDAICDLRVREETSVRNIGVVSADGTVIRCRDSRAQDVLQAWLHSHKVDFVIWTDLANNFQERRRQPYTVQAAIKYLQSLDSSGKSLAAEYIWRAPSFIDTPLRRAIEIEPWFRTS